MISENNAVYASIQFEEIVMVMIKKEITQDECYFNPYS